MRSFKAAVLFSGASSETYLGPYKTSMMKFHMLK